MASFLKKTSNLLMGATVLRLVAQDLRGELRRDAAAVGARANAMVHRSPYRAVGTVAAMGILAGLLLSRRH
jgi:ElaB/YqjD/DUF883 family membrane-anchored ribosome-binding protein